MADFAPITGDLSFSGGGKDYASAYQAALNTNKQNYGNIMTGYQNTGIALGNAQGRVKTGYQNLESSVMGQLAGIDRSQRQDISDVYAKNVGMASQDLINRGLGNSTVQQSVGRGLLYDKTKSDIALTGQTQGLNAQYMSQLGLARLGYEGQAAGQMANWQKGQLDFMNSVNAGYPDPNYYLNLAKMKGQSAGGAGMPGGGIPASGGSVKSPFGAGGGGYPSFSAWGNQGGGGRPATTTISSRGPGQAPLYPERDAGEMAPYPQPAGMVTDDYFRPVQPFGDYSGAPMDFSSGWAGGAGWSPAGLTGGYAQGADQGTGEGEVSRNLDQEFEDFLNS